MTNRDIVRDLIVYSITSVRYLLLKGHFNLFVKDLSFFAEWRKYRVSSKGTLDYRIPWLVFCSITILESWLKKSMQVFEYGLGGSTLYFAEKTKQVISVEQGKSWYNPANKAIHNQVVDNVVDTLIEPEPLP